MKVAPPTHDSLAFLLTQLGTHAAKKFADRLIPLKLAPHHAGILRILNRSENHNQRQLAATLHMHASRLVALIDELETMGLVIRESNGNDRRAYTLRITDSGRSAFAAIGEIGREHNRALCASLTKEECQQLARLLQRIADEQGLTRGIHPGYSQLKTPEKSSVPHDQTRSLRANLGSGSV